MSAEHIIEVWNRIDSEEPDISTELLMHLTASECGCDEGDVAYALIASGKWKEVA